MSGTHHLRERFDEKFLHAYNRLNIEQQRAVDAIEGPVMVIAGPGTGKTQILAVRIGRILRETDTQPYNILCLTYTEAASIAMRNRLVDIIGPDGHRVNIHTFHGFCNQVIQEHLGYFGNYRQLEQITDLEELALFQQLLDDLPDDHILKRLKTVTSHDRGRLKNLFVLMKREYYAEGDIIDACDRYLEQLKSDESMIYKRSGKGYKKGEFKQNQYDKIAHSMAELKAGATLFSVYKDLMKAMGRYDYDDMIMWVIEAFDNSQDILSEYQERYHYFLVDEFQDTNGAQKHLLDQLVSFWEDDPNIFVVGDDDQAIYKFQGANLDNITDFKQQYNPHPVVLKQNYRSSQKILDAAMALIDFNTERIVKLPDFHLDKDLIAQGANKDLNKEVCIRSYANLSQEQAHIALQIIQWHQEGKNLNRIAILYRKHAQIEKLIEVLERKGIPINVRKKVNILTLPLIQNIIVILRYLQDTYLARGYTNRMLFEMMHYSFFRIRLSDVSKLVWYNRTLNKMSKDDESMAGSALLITLISDLEQHPNIGLQDVDAVIAFRDFLDNCVVAIHDMTLQSLFQKIINEGHILNYIMGHADKSWLLQVLGTFFDLIKDESVKKPDFSLADLLNLLDSMNENSLPLAVNKVVKNTDGVIFSTAHSAKGMEYERVIVIGATKDVWDRKNNRNTKFIYPPDINGDVVTNQEDERRLMYVAMTRAEQSLDITYSLQKEDGKDLGASQFVDEVRLANDLEVQPQTVGADIVNDFQFYLLKQLDKIATLLDHDLIDKKLEGYNLSVTHLNKYLKCPITFYFETMLQVPMARTKYMGFGNAAHFALEQFYKDLGKGLSPTLQTLHSYYASGMSRHKSHFTTKEYNELSAHGRQILEAYFNTYLTNLPTNIRYELEVKIDHVEYEGIPIKGILDRVNVYKDYVTVTDYKTGNPFKSYNKPKLQAPSDRHPLGGDYWRQMVYYKILCNSDLKRQWNMTSGAMDFIEPDRQTGQFHREEYHVSPDHIDIVGDQIQSTWNAIHKHEFEQGCEAADCYWCNFVKNDFIGGSMLHPGIDD